MTRACMQTVVMPKIAPITKIQNCRELNADVRVEGAHIGASLYAPPPEVCAVFLLRVRRGFSWHRCCHSTAVM